MSEEREAEIRREIVKLSLDFQEAFRAAAAPLMDELVAIEMQKPTKPFVGPDGQTHVYVGRVPLVGEVE